MKSTVNPEPALSGCQPDHRVQKARTTPPESAFGYPRNFLDNHLVYVVVSARARGLSIGVNLNPDKHCNFDCVYCEVDRRVPIANTTLDLALLAEELESTIGFDGEQGMRTSAVAHSFPYRADCAESNGFEGR